LLLVGNINPVGTTLSSVYDIEAGKELSLKEIDPDAFELHERLYYSEFIEGQRAPEMNRVHPKYLVFRDSFDFSVQQRIEIGIEKGASEWIHEDKPIFKTLGDPFVAFSGWWDSDWGGYDFAWVANLADLQIVYTSNLMSGAPVRINYSAAIKQLMLIAGDGVQMVDVTTKTKTGNAIVIKKAKYFNTHTIWEGQPEIIDAVAHRVDTNRVVITERNRWYEMKPR
jgi:hypothetical protein